MSDSLASTRIVREISLLYELSLSVGRSLDLQENCAAFVRTLLARKNLAYASVWIKDEHLLGGDAQGSATLVFANPDYRAGERHLSLGHPLFARLEGGVVFSVGSSGEGFAELVTEKDVTGGAFAVFALGELGALKILSLATEEPLPASELNQLRNVIAQFAMSLEGCLAHQRLMDEVAERQRAQAMLLRRARQVQVGAEIAQEIASLATSDVLFRRVVDLVKEQLGYSYAHIFAYDSVRNALVLQEGRGEAGDSIKETGFSLPYGRGIVGTVAATKEALLVPDVTQFPDFIQHPDLPDTQSELAVPIVLGDELLGVLDVQRDASNALTEEDREVLVGLANQLASAVRNTRLLRQAHAALEEAEATNRRYLRARWAEFVPARAAAKYEHVEEGTVSLDGEQEGQSLDTLLSQRERGELEQAVERAMTAQETVVLSGRDGLADQAALVAPVRLRGEVIGALGFRTPQGERRWTSEDLALVQAVATQMALALENARLLDDTQRGQARERTVAEITARVRESLDMDAVLRAAVQELGEALRGAKVQVRLGTGPLAE